jgi:hypothetical protein
MTHYRTNGFPFAALLLSAVLLASCLDYGEESSHIDDRLPSAVSTRTVTNQRGDKFTIVRAAINGEEPGWFMLASASYYCIVDSKYVPGIRKLSKVTESEIPYPCKLPVTVYRSKSLTVGRLTIKNLDIAAFDLSGITETIEEEIVGILGYPVFAHAVVEIGHDDLGDDGVSVLDPKSYTLKEGQWHPLDTSNFQPVVTCRVNRQYHAPFVVDTGFNGAVSFYSVFAANHDVLEGRPATERPFDTVCGEAIGLEGTARVFEIAGNTFDNLTVSIQRPGSITDVAPGRLGGFVGRGLLAEFNVVFDMKNSRIALIPE